MNALTIIQCRADIRFCLTQVVATIVERVEENLPEESLLDMAGLPAFNPTPGFEPAPRAPYRTAPPRGILLDPKPPRWLRLTEPPPPSSPEPGLGAAAVILSLAYLCVKYLGPLLERHPENEGASLPKSVWHPGWIEELFKPLTQRLAESKRALYSKYLQRQGWFYTHANDVAGLTHSGHLAGHLANPRLLPQTEGVETPTMASAAPISLTAQPGPVIIEEDGLQGPRRFRAPQALISLVPSPTEAGSTAQRNDQQATGIWVTPTHWTTLVFLATDTSDDAIHYEPSVTLRAMHAAQQGPHPTLSSGLSCLHLDLFRQQYAGGNTPMWGLAPLSPRHTAMALSVAPDGRLVVGQIPAGYQLFVERQGSSERVAITDPRDGSVHLLGSARSETEPFASLTDLIDPLQAGDRLIAVAESGTELIYEQQAPTGETFPLSLDGQVGAGQVVQAPRAFHTFRVAGGDVATGMVPGSRDNQEDAYLVDDGLMIQADGMGGGEGGELASERAVRTVQAVVQMERMQNADGDVSPEALNRAISVAHQQILDDPAIASGTTLAILALSQLRPSVVLVGDSALRVYWPNPVTGEYNYVARLSPFRGLPEDELREAAAELASVIRTAVLGLADLTPQPVSDPNDLGSNRYVSMHLDELRRFDGQLLGPLQEGVVLSLSSDGIVVPQDLMLRFLNQHSGNPERTVRSVFGAMQDRHDRIAPYARGLRAGEVVTIRTLDPWLDRRSVDRTGRVYKLPAWHVSETARDNYFVDYAPASPDNGTLLIHRSGSTP